MRRSSDASDLTLFIDQFGPFSNFFSVYGGVADNKTIEGLKDIALKKGATIDSRE